MDQNDNRPAKDLRFIAKIKNIITQTSSFKKIIMDNIRATNPDGTPNPYYKGCLLWLDSTTGKYYQVKQMGISTPKDGMKGAQFGYESNITIDLNDFEEKEPGYKYGDVIALP